MELIDNRGQCFGVDWVLWMIVIYCWDMWFYQVLNFVGNGDVIIVQVY